VIIFARPARRVVVRRLTGAPGRGGRPGGLAYGVAFAPVLAESPGTCAVFAAAAPLGAGFGLGAAARGLARRRSGGAAVPLRAASIRVRGRAAQPAFWVSGCELQPAALFDAGAAAQPETSREPNALRSLVPSEQSPKSRCWLPWVAVLREPELPA